MLCAKTHLTCVRANGALHYNMLYLIYVLLSIFSPLSQVSTDELREIMTSQDSGAIVYISPDSHPPSMWTRFLELDQHEKLAHMKKIASFGKEPSDDEEVVRPSWSFRKLLPSIFRKDKSKDARKSDAKRTTKLDSYNLYDRRPDFRNDYGWSLALDESDYAPLGRSGVGVYLVNLTAVMFLFSCINLTGIIPLLYFTKISK